MREIRPSLLKPMLITTSVLVRATTSTFDHFTISYSFESVFVNFVILCFFFFGVRRNIAFVNAPVKIIMSSLNWRSYRRSRRASVSACTGAFVVAVASAVCRRLLCFSVWVNNIVIRHNNTRWFYSGQQRYKKGCGKKISDLSRFYQSLVRDH